ncbi:hypothetical protein D3C73_917760 [compost metagenome]
MLYRAWLVLKAVQFQDVVGAVAARVASGQFVVDMTAFAKAGPPLDTHASLVAFRAHDDTTALPHRAHGHAGLRVDGLGAERQGGPVGQLAKDQHLARAQRGVNQLDDGAGSGRGIQRAGLELDVHRQVCRVHVHGVQAVRAQAAHHRVTAAVHAVDAITHAHAPRILGMDQRHRFAHGLRQRHTAAVHEHGACCAQGRLPIPPPLPHAGRHRTLRKVVAHARVRALGVGAAIVGGRHGIRARAALVQRAADAGRQTRAVAAVAGVDRAQAWRAGSHVPATQRDGDVKRQLRAFRAAPSAPIATHAGAMDPLQRDGIRHVSPVVVVANRVIDVAAGPRPVVGGGRRRIHAAQA